MIKTGQELADSAINVARHYKTLYVLGAFGAPMTEQNKERYLNSNPYNARTDRTVAIKSATAETFGFDCVGLIKGLLWDWSGQLNTYYGGADYCKHGIGDLNANQMIQKCTDVSTDFSDVFEGEVVWMTDHIGIYIGGGLAVECTSRWTDGVQITAVHNIGEKSGYNGRKWTNHGKLPWITYSRYEKDGWHQDDQGWYCLEFGKRIVSQWVKDSVGWCYVGSDGYMVTDRWEKDGRFWCYVDESGHMLRSQWKKDSADWCYIDERGHVLTNAWVQDSGGWCFVKDDGRILRDGYASDSAGQHYIDVSGHMVG